MEARECLLTDGRIKVMRCTPPSVPRLAVFLQGLSSLITGTPHMTKQHLPFSFLPTSSAEMLANENCLEKLQNSEVKRIAIIKIQETLCQRIQKV